MAKKAVKKIDTSEIQTWKDVFFPILYVGLILILAFFIWRLISPIISIAVAGLLTYLYYLRRIISKK